MTTRPSSPAERRARLIIAATITSFGAFLFSAVLVILDLEDHLRSAIAADTSAYERLGAQLLAGAMPYMDLAVEHLPIAVFPIWVLTWIATVLGVTLDVVWVPAMALCFIVSIALIDSIDTDHPVGFQCLAVAAPLLPLVLFRLELWVGLLVVLAMVAYARDRYKPGAAWTVIGVLAKGWPILMVAYPWKAGRRWLTLRVTVFSSVALAAVAFTPGFRDARAFDGIHSETIVGNLIIVWRQLVSGVTGLDTAAGAVYVAAPDWTVVVNAVPGVVVLAMALYLFTRGSHSFRNTTNTVGLAVIGIILMSPLFSTQFIFWLTPFIAFATLRARKVYIIAACIGLATVAVYQPESLWWNLEVLAKNGAIVWLTIVWMRSLLANQRPQPDSTSRRNLPV